LIEASLSEFEVIQMSPTVSGSRVTDHVMVDEPAVLPPGTIDPGDIGSFEGSDGRLLRYRIVASHGAKHHLLYLHGIESHGAWFLPAAAMLRDFGCTTYLLDRRGSGLNMNPSPGDVSSARILLEDVRRFRGELHHVPMHLVGLSWGGKLAAAVALDQPDGLQSLILITPGLRYHTDLSPLAKARVFLSLIMGGRTRFEVPIEPHMFTQTPRFLEFIRKDPWRMHEVTARFLLISRIMDWRLARRIGNLRLPILLFLGGKDPIIDNRGVVDLLSAVKDQVRLQLFEDGMHAIQFDQTGRLVRQIGTFVEEVEGRC
jgi:alpha-beta hydrolase superfamily lysophospholipase